jgi:hypothetical protein
VLCEMAVFGPAPRGADVSSISGSNSPRWAAGENELAEPYPPDDVAVYCVEQGKVTRE